MDQDKKLKERDKEIRLQALKIKEIVYAGSDAKRQSIIQKDYQLLQNLSSASNPNRHLGSNSTDPNKSAILDQ
jgi:hypothetical protein